jgi:hypothetical protein
MSWEDVELSPYKKTKRYLWFRQSLPNTLWLLRHADSPREFWRILRGRCIYCGKPDCAD